jgi:hypothetical protein
VGVVALDQGAVVAVHRADELCERNNNTRRKAVPEGGGLGGELDRKVGKPGALGRAFRHQHRLHQTGALTAV